jgi:hypothetical protein
VIEHAKDHHQQPHILFYERKMALWSEISLLCVKRMWHESTKWPWQARGFLFGLVQHKHIAVCFFNCSDLRPKSAVVKEAGNCCVGPFQGWEHPYIPILRETGDLSMGCVFWFFGVWEMKWWLEQDCPSCHFRPISCPWFASSSKSLAEQDGVKGR